MEERLKMLSQQSIDAMNAEANDDNYEIASVGVVGIFCSLFLVSIFFFYSYDHSL